MPPMQPDRPVLPDLLAPGLRVVFVGTAAGRRSAQLGQYYAGPSNRFWRTLHEVGLTPRRFEPREFPALLALGIGLTDMSKRGFGQDHEIASGDFDPDGFEARMRRYRPRAIALTSKRAACIWLRRRRTAGIAYGWQQPGAIDFPAAFVLPSPSGAARSSWSIAPWQQLADWVKGPP